MGVGLRLFVLCCMSACSGMRMRNIAKHVAYIQEVYWVVVLQLWVLQCKISGLFGRMH